MEQTKITNDKCFKPLKRFLKDTGKYQEFKMWIRTQNFFGKAWDMYYKNNMSSIYTLFSKEYRDINDYTNYLTTDVLGVDNSMKLFKNFIIDNYGKDTYETFLNNIDPTFIKKHTAGYKTIKYKKGIRKLPFKVYLFFAFEWQKTKQGHEFWQYINEKWMASCELLMMDMIEKNKKT